MKTSRLIAAPILLTLAIATLSPHICCAAGTKVEWLQGYVSATARGYAKKTGAPFDIDNAVDAAKVVARSELLQAVKGVMVDNQTAVSDLMSEHTETTVKVSGVLHDAAMVGDPVLKEVNGFVEATVEMRVCLFGGGACRYGQPLLGMLPKLAGKKASGCGFQPSLTSTSEILSKVKFDVTHPLSVVVVNVKGAPFNLSSKDVIIGYQSSSGERCSVYGPDNVNPAVRRDRGTASILLHASQAAQNFGPNNLVIVAKSIDQNNYVVLEDKDAYLLQLVNQTAGGAIFRDARIGIAADD